MVKAMQTICLVYHRTDFAICLVHCVSVDYILFKTLLPQW